MSIPELIDYLQKQANEIANKQGLAIQVGDLAAIEALGNQLAETYAAIEKLRT